MISYLITDSKYYGNTTESLISTLTIACKNNKVDFACLRDKENSISKNSYKNFILACNSLSIKPIIHTDIKSAEEFGAFGVHLSAYDFNKIAIVKNKKLFVIASTHNLAEATLGVSCGADFITLSPIFSSPDKGLPIGLVKLKEIADKMQGKCIALGGILKNSQIEACKNAGAIGFASIRYFIK